MMTKFNSIAELIHDKYNGVGDKTVVLAPCGGNFSYIQSALDNYGVGSVIYTAADHSADNPNPLKIAKTEFAKNDVRVFFN